MSVTLVAFDNSVNKVGRYANAAADDDDDEGNCDVCFVGVLSLSTANRR